VKFRAPDFFAREPEQAHAALCFQDSAVNDERAGTNVLPTVEIPAVE